MSEKESYPKGFLLNAISAGIKANGELDMGILYSQSPCHYFGVFTRNKIQAAPVRLCRERLNTPIHGLIVNSGKANSFTGTQGLKDAYTITQLAEEALKVRNESMLSLSTGVIGEPLPMDTIKEGVKKLCRLMESKENQPSLFAQSICTTDTKVKEITLCFEVDGRQVCIYGSAKGSGMIFPNMATMLAFIVTDLSIAPHLMAKALTEAVDESFNAISVDGDQSTNDSVIHLANGEVGNPIIDKEDQNYQKYKEALKEVALYLAQSIVRDGEGATKFIEIAVKGALSKEDAQNCASHIANSLLVKTAFFGEDANWGRFIYAVGASGCEVDETTIDMKLGTILLVEKGVRTDFKDQDASRYMKNHDLYLEINLGLGEYSKTMYTCDLSYDYVKINGDYRT